jgi:hypothetical protein
VWRDKEKADQRSQPPLQRSREQKLRPDEEKSGDGPSEIAEGCREACKCEA